MKVPDTITDRLAQLDAIEATYKAYARQRLEEQDWHGLWDVAINLSEVSCERDGLQRAAAAFEAAATVGFGTYVDGKFLRLCVWCREPLDPDVTAGHVCPAKKKTL